MGYVNSISSGIVSDLSSRRSININSPSLIENSLSQLSAATTTPSVSASSSSSNPDKLFKSINLLKSIIEKISQSRADATNPGTANSDLLAVSAVDSKDSNSLDQLYALAQNSVTLSYKDYILMQQATTSSLNTAGNSILNLFTTSTKSTDFIMMPTSEQFHNSTHTHDTTASAIWSNSSLLIFISLFYSILILTSLISNPLLIYILLWRRKAQIKLIDIFVANLSLSDLFLTILNIPLCLIIYFSERWPFGSVLCKLGTFSTSCSIYVNIFTMAYISIDRYFAVTRPLLVSNPRKKSVLLDNQTRQKIYSVLTFIWIIALILSIPQIIFSKVSDDISSSLADARTLLELELEDLDSLSAAGGHNDTNLLSDLNKDLNRLSIGEDDPFKKCVLEYPYPNMKNYMILVNFLLQYLIPSIVILYFYGKIIYHLYLNLNMDDLMDSAPVSHHAKSTNIQRQYVGSLSPILSSQHAAINKKKNKFIFKSKTSYDLDSEGGGDKTPRSAAIMNTNTSNTSSTPNLKRNQLYNSSIKNAFSTPVVDLINNDTSPSTVMTPILIRKQSRGKLRVEGFTRTRNLKKSIKIMIIIIVLFLLSWLPIHVYRLLTTYYPIVQSYFNSKLNGARGDTSARVSPHGGEDHSESVLSKMSETTVNGTLISVLCSMYQTTSQAYRDCLLAKWKTLDYKSLFNNSSVSSYNEDQFKLDTMHNRYAFFVCYFMAMSSVCYNPIVYFWMHKKFRAEVKLLFLNIVYKLRCKKKKNKSNSVNIGRSNRHLQTSLLTTSSTNTTRRRDSRNQSLLNSSSQTTSTTANTRKSSNNSLIRNKRNSQDNVSMMMATRMPSIESSQSSGFSIQYTSRPSGLARNMSKMNYLDYLKRSRRSNKQDSNTP